MFLRGGSKPIDRAQIVLGKSAGHLLLALEYLLLLSAGILLMIRVVGDLAPAGVPRALPLLMLEIALSAHRRGGLRRTVRLGAGCGQEETWPMTR